jgi:hypothetical protein
MVLTITVGKTGRLDVGASTANQETLGVQSVDIPMDWETKKIMHLSDSAKTTIMLLKNWTLNLTLTEDLADAGQDIIRTAYNGGSNIAFKLYPDYVGAATEFYTCAYGRVTKYSTKVDPNSEINASVTIESSGTAITLPV